MMILATLVIAAATAVGAQTCDDRNIGRYACIRSERVQCTRVGWMSEPCENRWKCYQRTQWDNAICVDPREPDPGMGRCDRIGSTKCYGGQRYACSRDLRWLISPCRSNETCYQEYPGDPAQCRYSGRNDCDFEQAGNTVCMNDDLYICDRDTLTWQNIPCNRDEYCDDSGDGRAYCRRSFFN